MTADGDDPASLWLHAADDRPPGDPPPGWTRLSDLVEAAAERIAPGSFALVVPESHAPYDDAFHAYFVEAGPYVTATAEAASNPVAFERRPGQQLWVDLAHATTQRLVPGDDDVPVAFVDLHPTLSDRRHVTTHDGAANAAVMRLDATDPAGASAEIGRWLMAHTSAGLADRERELIERVIAEIRRAIDEGRFDSESSEDVAQTQAAIDTAAAQLRAPRPSRSIVARALAQLPPFAIGALSGVAGNFLTEFIRQAL